MAIVGCQMCEQRQTDTDPARPLAGLAEISGLFSVKQLDMCM